MLAFRAGNSFGHLEDGLLVQVRHSCFASVGHEELRRNRSAEHLVLAPQLPLENTKAMEEEQLGFQLGASACSLSVEGYEESVRNP